MMMKIRYDGRMRKLAAVLVAAMLCSLMLAPGAAQAQEEAGGVYVPAPFPGAGPIPMPIPNPLPDQIPVQVPIVEPPILLSPKDKLVTEDSTPELWLQAAHGLEIVVADADGHQLAGALGRGKQKVVVTLPTLEPKLHWLRVSASYATMASAELRIPLYVDGDAVFNVQDVVRIIRQSEQYAGFDYGIGGVSGFMRELLGRTNTAPGPELEWTGFAGVNEVSVQVDHANRYIEAVVPFGTDLAMLRSEFGTAAGAAVSVGGVQQTSGSTANDFNRPVFYEVSDGSRKATYAVNVIAEPGIHDFRFVNTNPQVLGAIDQANRAIDVVVPYGTSLSGLIAGYEASPGSIVTVDGVPQVAGVTANDYSEPVVISLQRDGRTVSYAVHVTVDEAPPVEEPEMTYFGLIVGGEPIAGTIGEDRAIDVTVPHGTTLEGLIASFETTPDTVVTVGGVVQTAGVTENDYTEPVVYALQRQGQSVSYTVTVTEDEAPPAELPEMTYFGLIVGGEPISGVIQEDHTIRVTVPYGTELGELLALFETSEDTSVTVNGEVQYSGDSIQNYSLPVTYILTAGEHQTAYVVHVTAEEPAGEPTIDSFGILLGDTTVTGHVYGNHAIEVYVPFGTDVTSLAAVFETAPYAEATVNGVPQVSGVTLNDYSEDVVFTVTLGSASRDYTVRIGVLPEETTSCAGLLCDLQSWTIDANSGLWNVLPFDNDLVNGAYGILSSTRAGDASGGALPDGPTGSTSTHALWYGKPSGNQAMEIGNYLNVWSGSTSMNGGSSASAHAGSVLSPSFTVGSQSGYAPYLTFDAWWEIEGQDPSGYDLMQVYAVSGNERVLLGNLNDTIEQEENDDATPQTSGGLGAAPIWTTYAYDLSQFANEEIRIELRFSTQDSSYNAFRGWFVTDVQVEMVSTLVMMPPGEDGGRVVNPELPPVREE